MTIIRTLRRIGHKLSRKGSDQTRAQQFLEKGRNALLVTGTAAVAMSGVALAAPDAAPAVSPDAAPVLDSSLHFENGFDSASRSGMRLDLNTVLHLNTPSSSADVVVFPGEDVEQVYNTVEPVAHPEEGAIAPAPAPPPEVAVAPAPEPVPEPAPAPPPAPAIPPGNIDLAQMEAAFPQLPSDLAAEYLPFLNAAMTEFGIDSPPKVASFLAQLSHESIDLYYFKELQGESARYAPYFGRGPLQITWEDTYAKAGVMTGLDLVGNPEQVATKEVGFRTSAWAFAHLHEERGFTSLMFADGSWAGFDQTTSVVNYGEVNSLDVCDGVENRRNAFARIAPIVGWTPPDERPAPMPD